VPPDVPVLPPDVPEPPIVPVEPPMVPVEPPIVPVPPMVPLEPPIVPVEPIVPGVEVEPLPEVDPLPEVEPDVPRLRPRLERLLREPERVPLLCIPVSLPDMLPDAPVEPVPLDPVPIEPEPVAVPVVPLVPVVWAKAAAGIINAAAAAIVKIRMEVSPVVLGLLTSQQQVRS
jgi:hypothetical protein